MAVRHERRPAGVPAAVPAADAMMTKGEVAKFLRCSISHLERLAKRSDGPPQVKIGRRVVYHAKALDAWLAARTGR